MGDLTYEGGRFDYVWWMLAPNPFVILADATPIAFDGQGNPVDLFGQVSTGVRRRAAPADLESSYDECTPEREDYESARRSMPAPLPAGSWGSPSRSCCGRGARVGVGAHAHARETPAAGYPHRLSARIA